MLRGYLYSFNYTKEDSEAIYNHFHQGDDLWCKDDIVDTAKLISTTKTFSNEAVSLAVKMFGGAKSVNKSTKTLKQLGYHILSRRKLSWYSIKKALTESEWIDIQKDIVARKCISGNVVSRCLSTQQIGQNLLFNYMYGCVDSPEEYNSGMCFMEGKESEVWGIQNEMHKEPLTPDAGGKIYAKWHEDGKVAPRERSFHVPDAFMPQLKRVLPK